ncbi:APC amino acid permease [Gonapodya prolifera JEL478]|uniref:APC amino acid permease n=1 Tax=Gonapodya prolifera (strain JEL478) TaxID=1344416 RepID=A0A139AHB8_GONPJ|nr:APC amino acid permease [Gonapodya prolifera JEL478]|eukprot:KXS15835.1 APC amino acid permease [Gonapodya prolifera JEL478]
MGVDQAHGLTEDEIRLARMGYRQEFKRGFGLLHTFGISMSHITILGAIGALFTFAVGYGGPAGTVYGWIFVSLMSLSVGSSMAEICSAYPTAGGLYYWSSKLGGDQFGPVFAWFTGWYNLIGDVAACAGGGYSVAQCIFSCVLVYYPDYDIQLWKFGLLGVMVNFTWAILNSLDSVVMKRLLEFSVLVHTVGLLSIVIILLVLTPNRQSASFVFTEVDNFYSGQDSQGFSILLSFLMPCWTFVGYDASAHVSEETVEAYKQASRGIVLAIITSAVGGFILILGEYRNTITRLVARDLRTKTTAPTPKALLFTIVDLELVLGSTYPAPLMQLFLDSTNGNQPVAVYLMSIIIAANYFAGVSTICANSRMIYAFSRDKAFGKWFSGFLYWTTPYTRLPVRTVWFSAILSNLIQSIGFGSSIGLQVVASISTIGNMTAYALPIFCRLTFARSVFKKGEFHLGPFSEIIGWIAITWVSFLFVLLCLPYNYPVTAINFNYASVLIGGVTFFASAFWTFSARHWFRGPVPRVSEDEVQVMEESVAAWKNNYA